MLVALWRICDNGIEVSWSHRRGDIGLPKKAVKLCLCFGGLDLVLDLDQMFLS